MEGWLGKLRAPGNGAPGDACSNHLTNYRPIISLGRVSLLANIVPRVSCEETLINRRESARKRHTAEARRLIS
jgi:hypothetical protein